MAVAKKVASGADVKAHAAGAAAVGVTRVASPLEDQMRKSKKMSNPCDLDKNSDECLALRFGGTGVILPSGDPEVVCPPGMAPNACKSWKNKVVMGFHQERRRRDMGM